MLMLVAGFSSAPPKVIVQGPSPPLHPESLSGILNVIALLSGAKFAALIASRKVQPPGSVEHNPSSVSAVVLTTSDAGGASSFVIVSVVGFVPLIVAVSVGLDRVIFTVSSAS